MQPLLAAGKVEVPRRMVCVETNMGILPQFFFPEKAGKDYALSPYLERLASVRRKNVKAPDFPIFLSELFNED